MVDTGAIEVSTEAGEANTAGTEATEASEATAEATEEMAIEAEVSTVVEATIKAEWLVTLLRASSARLPTTSSSCVEGAEAGIADIVAAIGAARIILREKSLLSIKRRAREKRAARLKPIMEATEAEAAAGATMEADRSRKAQILSTGTSKTGKPIRVASSKDTLIRVRALVKMTPGLPINRDRITIRTIATRSPIKRDSLGKLRVPLRATVSKWSPSAARARLPSTRRAALAWPEALRSAAAARTEVAVVATTGAVTTTAAAEATTEVAAEARTEGPRVRPSLRRANKDKSELSC